MFKIVYPEEIMLARIKVLEAEVERQREALRAVRDTGIGFPTGQAIKKITEAVGMLGRGEGDAAARELLGAIVYTAAAVKFIREDWE